MLLLSSMSLLTLNSCFVTYKQPYEGVLNKYFQKINFIIFDLVVTGVMFLAQILTLSITDTFMNQCYHSLLPDAIIIVSHD